MDIRIYAYTHVISLCVYVHTYTLIRARILHAIRAMAILQYLPDICILI